jgi:uncharacterized protein YcfJ
MKLFSALTLVLCTLFVFAPIVPAQAEMVKVMDFDKITDGISDGIGDIAGKIKTKDLKAKKDPVTLAIGGVVGLLAGSLVSSFVDVEMLGISMVPVAGALAGIYLANEGYLEKFQ